MTADSTSSPDEQPTPLPVCPNGKSDCAIIEQLVEISQSLTELSQLVRTDPLTGLANYRTFCKALVHEMERTQRSGQPTTLIMLDIDHFKNVNDSWGHEIGNQALVHIAKLLQRTVRRLDIPCRYGGEEFAIILPNTELSASVLVAERLRQIIAETPLLMGEQTSPEELVQRADHYLYQAKQKGRNQVRHTKLPPVEIVGRDEKDALLNLFGRGARKDQGETAE